MRTRLALGAMTFAELRSLLALIFGMLLVLLA
jgi:hypothetical protein